MNSVVLKKGTQQVKSKCLGGLLGKKKENKGFFISRLSFLKCLFFYKLHVKSFSIICPRPNESVPDVVARRHLKQPQSPSMLFAVLMLVSTSAGVVLQRGMARHGVLPRCGHQRHPQGKSAGRTGPPPVRHLRVQSPPQPHQGAALLRCHVSHQTEKKSFMGQGQGRNMASKM